MTLQHTLLRAMLWTLGLAAIAGIATMFVSNKDFTGRVFATGLISAMAIGLAMPVSKLLDREAAREGALAGLGTIIATYLFSLAGVWVGFGLGGFGLQETLVLSAVTVGLCGLVASVLIGLRRSPAHRLTSLVGLVCVACAFALSFASVWESRLGLNLRTGDCMATVGYLSLLGSLSCLCLIGASVDRRHWRYLGVALALGAFAIAMHHTWISGAASPLWFYQCVIGATVVAHANVVFRIALPPAHRWLTFGASGAMILTAACMSVINWITEGFEQNLANDLVGRGAAAGGIVTGCATLAIIVLNRFNRRPEPVSIGAITGIAAVSLACPRCRTRQDAPLGASGCVKCGLILSVSVASPQCPACGYCTLDLTGDKCPECGGSLFPRGRVIPTRPPRPLDLGD